MPTMREKFLNEYKKFFSTDLLRKMVFPGDTAIHSSQVTLTTEDVAALSEIFFYINESVANEKAEKAQRARRSGITTNFQLKNPLELILLLRRQERHVQQYIAQAKELDATYGETSFQQEVDQLINSGTDLPRDLIFSFEKREAVELIKYICDRNNYFYSLLFAGLAGFDVLDKYSQTPMRSFYYYESDGNSIEYHVAVSLALTKWFSTEKIPSIQATKDFAMNYGWLRLSRGCEKLDRATLENLLKKLSQIKLDRVEERRELIQHIIIFQLLRENYPFRAVGHYFSDYSISNTEKFLNRVKNHCDLPAQKEIWQAFAVYFARRWAAFAGLDNKNRLEAFKAFFTETFQDKWSYEDFYAGVYQQCYENLKADYLQNQPYFSGYLYPQECGLYYKTELHNLFNTELGQLTDNEAKRKLFQRALGKNEQGEANRGLSIMFDVAVKDRRGEMQGFSGGTTKAIESQRKRFEAEVGDPKPSMFSRISSLLFQPPVVSPNTLNDRGLAVKGLGLGYGSEDDAL